MNIPRSISRRGMAHLILITTVVFALTLISLRLFPQLRELRPPRRPVALPPAPQQIDPTLVPAFPGAEGAGALTPGGRGGRVIAVTNLNDSGPGSLRAAIEAKGPRIVVFQVGGIIELRKPIFIDEPYLTIAGQTAPGGGITLKGTDEGGGKMLVLRDVHDVIIRYLRIRSGAHGEAERGQINIAIDSGVHDVIIDHTSLSWTLDENLMIHRNIPDDTDPDAWPGIQKITVQRSILAEGLWPHSTGVQIGGEAELEGWRAVHDITLHHNLFASNSLRNPGIGSAGTQVINNVVYNWGSRLGETWYASTVDWIGNYFKPGSLSNPDRHLVHAAFFRDSPQERFPPPSLYLYGNIALPDHTNPGTNDWELYVIHYEETPLPNEFLRVESLPHTPIPVTIQTAEEAYHSVLMDVGANARLDCEGNWVANSDAVDMRLVSDVREGTSSSGRFIRHEDEVGGYPQIDSGTGCLDSDHDGMPDAWEVNTNVLDPHADDSAGYDLDPNYTNIEVYLAGNTSYLSGK